MLPCGDIDEIAEFSGVLGFARTYRQVRPNPCIVMRREDFELHFFGIPDFDPEESYGTCGVFVPDIVALWEAFAAGMRSAYGKVLVSGTRVAAGQARQDPAAAVVLGDAHDDDRQAAKILADALRREQETASPVELVRALVYRAELAVRLREGEYADESGARSSTSLTAPPPVPAPHPHSGRPSSSPRSRMSSASATVRLRGWASFGVAGGVGAVVRAGEGRGAGRLLA